MSPPTATDLLTENHAPYPPVEVYLYAIPSGANAIPGNPLPELDTLHKEAFGLRASLHDTQSRLLQELEKIQITKCSAVIDGDKTPTSAMVTVKDAKQIELESALQISRDMHDFLTDVLGRFKKLWTLLRAIHFGFVGPIDFSADANPFGYVQQVQYLIRFQEIAMQKVKNDLKDWRALVSVDETVECLTEHAC